LLSGRIGAVGIAIARGGRGRRAVIRSALALYT
jgi:hypothetical protein